MIDANITRTTKKGKSRTEESSFVFSGSGKEVLIWAENIYNRIAPRIRHRGGTMIGDLPLVDTPIFLGFLSKAIYYVNSEGVINVFVNDNSLSISYTKPMIRFDVREDVPKSLFVNLSLYRTVKMAYETYVASHDFEVTQSEWCFINLAYDSDTSKNKKEYLYVSRNHGQFYLTKKEFDIVSLYQKGIRKNALISSQTGYSQSSVSKILRGLREKGVIE